MKCKIHGYKHNRKCRYCNDSTRWVDDDYITTQKDKDLKWKIK